MKIHHRAITIIALSLSCQQDTLDGMEFIQSIPITLSVTGPAGEPRSIRAIVSLDDKEIARYTGVQLDAAGTASFRLQLGLGSRGQLKASVQAIGEDALLTDTAQSTVTLDKDQPYSVELPLQEVDYCGRDLWCWSRPKHVGTSFTDVWGTSPNDIWVVGTSGRPLHYDGFAFSEVPLIDEKVGTSEEIITPRFMGIHGTSASDVWLSSALYLGKTKQNGLWKYDGSAFRVMYREGATFPMGSGVFSQILVTPSWIWMGGCQFDRSGTLSKCTLPSATSITRMVQPDQANPEEFWGIGKQNGTSVILHWDGAAWSTESIGNFPLFDIQVADNQSMLCSRQDGGLVFRKNGNLWETTPKIGNTGIVISAASESDIWSITGLTEWPFSETSPKKIEHWNGSIIEGADPIPTELSITKAFTVPGTDRSMIILVGIGGVVYRFDRNTKKLTVLLKGASGIPSRMNDIYGFGQNDIWAVGQNGTMVHYDGKSWNSIPQVTKKHLNRLWGINGKDIWAVGTAKDPSVSGAAPDAAIVRIVNGKPQLLPGHSVEDLNSVWGGSASNVYMVGSNSTVLRTDGNGNWSRVDIGIPEKVYLSSVWASSETNVWIGGGYGAPFVLVYYDGNSWKSLPAYDGKQPVFSIKGSSPSNVLVGFSNRVARYDGSMLIDAAWRGCKALHMFGPNSWFSASDEWGFYSAKSGPQPHQGTQPGVREILGMWAYQPYDIWMSGYAGAILHLNPKAQIPW